MAFVKKCWIFCTSVIGSSASDAITSANMSKKMGGTPLPFGLYFDWLKTFYRCPYMKKIAPRWNQEYCFSCCLDFFIVIVVV